MTSVQIIEYYNMKPLPKEGGYFCEGQRNGCISSTILYLITKDSFSRMHKLPKEEVYHFYMGDPVEQLQLLPDGTGKVIRLGQDILCGEYIQYSAPADCWHGTRLADGGEWALMGATLAPAWDDSDYTDGAREELILRWPGFEKEILRRT